MLFRRAITFIQHSPLALEKNAFFSHCITNNHRKLAKPHSMSISNRSTLQRAAKDSSTAQPFLQYILWQELLLDRSAKACLSCRLFEFWPVFFLPETLIDVLKTFVFKVDANTVYGRVRGTTYQVQHDSIYPYYYYVSAFLGLPYAVPPTGENRFQVWFLNGCTNI